MFGLTKSFSNHEPENADILNTERSAMKRFNLLEHLSALSLTLMALYLHWLNFMKVGGFWRDEANSITLALLPDMTRLWTALQFDSFPVMHYMAIRSWSCLFGSTDTSLRLMGLIIGVLLIVALWYKSVSFGGRAPLMSLLLIGINPVMIRSLDAIRPNGLAALFTVLAFTAVWHALRRTDIIRLTIATVVLVLTVQILFQTTIFILAMGIAVIALGFYKGGLRRALLLAIPFIIAALSVLPYIGLLREAASWVPVAASLPESKFLIPGLLKVVDAPVSWMWCVWLTFAITAMGSILIGLVRRSSCPEIDGQLTLYCGVTIMIAAVLFMLFLAKGVGFSPQPWHYIPLLVLLVIAAESMIDQCLVDVRWRMLILLFVVGIVAATIGKSSDQLQSKVTSIDLVAAAIAYEARPTDLVVLEPWHYSVSFSRYYHGIAPWISFPALRENSLHRYDLLRERMRSPETISDDLSIIMATLRRGGKVWVVGSGYFLEPGTEVKLLPPAPLPQSGWSSSPYLTNWSRYLHAALATHSRESEQLSVNSSQKFNPQESPALIVFRGYKE